MNALSLARLEGFYWVARTEGYARAARAFPYPITQPGVHQQVRRLEEEIGVELFERVGKDRVALTVEGRGLYAFVAPFYERLPGLVAELRAGEVGGKLRLHASGLAIRQLLPPWLRRLQARRPDIEVDLAEVQTPSVEALRRGEADLLVDHLPEVPPDIDARPVATAHAFLVLPANHRLASRGTFGFTELAGESFIGYRADAHLRAMQLAALAEHAPGVKPTHAADSAEAILAFVAAGIGISLVPSLLPSGPRVPGVKVIPVRGKRAAFVVHAAWRRSPIRHALVEAALALAPTATTKSRSVAEPVPQPTRPKAK
jgi:DNA-binding transcriptional LysR family regulator